MQALEAYGGCVCACCGETTVEFLTIDHIDGGGTKHRKQICLEGRSYRRFAKGKSEFKGCGNMTANFYSWLKRNKYPPGFQVLCMNCNFAKGKYGECPHQKKKREATEVASSVIDVTG